MTGLRRSSWLVVALLGMGCGTDEAPRPPELYLGADTCDSCRMIISEERHAAAARHRETREEVRFDDLGCLVGLLQARDEALWDVWAHDESSNWISARSARYVRLAGANTPMGYGWHALSAEAADAGEDKAHDWAALLSQTRKRHSNAPERAWQPRQESVSSP